MLLLILFVKKKLYNYKPGNICLKKGFSLNEIINELKYQVIEKLLIFLLTPFQL